MLPTVLAILGILCAIAATVLVFIFILPENKKDALPKFFKIVRRILNMDDLLIEKILKALYIFSTMFCVFGGFFELFNFQTYSAFGYSTGVIWNGWQGLLLMIFGPVVVRLVYEALMLFVTLVQRVLSIDRKIPAPKQDAQEPKNED